jgi:hypothetical protein
MTSHPTAATTKTQKHEENLHETLFVSSFVSSCLGGCDEQQHAQEDPQ